MREAPPPSDRQTALVRYRLLALAIFVSLGATSAILLRSDPPVSASPLRVGLVPSIGWIASQTFASTLPGVLAAFLLASVRPRVAMLVGTGWLLAVFAVVIGDLITFGWIGERFLSLATWRLFTKFREPIIGHVTQSMLGAAIAVFVGCVIYAIASFHLANKFANAASHRGRVRPGIGLAICCVVASLVSLPALSDGHETWTSMANRSAPHPFCMLRLVHHRGVGPSDAPNASMELEPSLDEATSEGKKRSRVERGSASAPMATAIRARDQRQRRLSVTPSPKGERVRPDVLIVVVESFRHELVDEQIMPHLWRYAQKGLHCRQHFSGGNATNHGMFSLLNGLEAIWYERDVRYSPLLNRLFRQAGYQLGFFGGHNDWREFLMDGYISADHYDVFEIDDPNGLASDRAATQRAASFLEGTSNEKPRLCVLYLYATHAMYPSYVKDQIFQPAADDRFLFPYTSAEQPRVWNRYKNSAHCVDRFLDAVMRPDRIVIVTGDHGESFLEDGVCGHGVRVSSTQNMTPAIVYVPGVTPCTIDAPTMHADLLPTLLSAVGISVNDANVLDGDDLIGASDDELERRVFATRNYLLDDLAIIGRWTGRPEQPFAIRGKISLPDATAVPLNAIDSNGFELPWDQAQVESGFRRWQRERFGERR